MNLRIAALSLSTALLFFLATWFAAPAVAEKKGRNLLEVDEDGQGQGSIVATGRVKFNEEGVLEAESYGQQPMRLINVRRRSK